MMLNLFAWISGLSGYQAVDPQEGKAFAAWHPEKGIQKYHFIT